jgi:biopolymer transport protein ExbD
MKLGEVTNKEREGQEINVAPLIDMVFILLIFFMVTTTFAKDLKLDLQRPDAQSAQEVAREVLRVAVDRTSNMTIDGTPVSPWMLQAKVREALALGHYANVLVVADEKVETGTLVNIVDECRLAGASDVGVAVEEGR